MAAIMPSTYMSTVATPTMHELQRGTKDGRKYTCHVPLAAHTSEQPSKHKLSYTPGRSDALLAFPELGPGALPLLQQMPRAICNEDLPIW